MLEQWMLTTWPKVGLVFLSAAGIYAAVIACTRISGLRSFSKMSSFDFAMTIGIGTLLVVEFWPNHYMALYHAGSARYRQGDHEGARSLLHRFLNEHTSEDAWRLRALEMLMETDEG